MIFPMKATAWNTGWLFRHLDSQENFVPVTLPHDAMQAEPRTELSANGINGGWYEGRDYEYIRRFTPDKSLRSKTLMLEFEGVYHLAEVYLNGEKIAERPYGYTNFYADLTDRVRFDEENELRVIARNSDQPNSRWYSGAGIYRPVVLWTADKQQHIALNGVRIRTVSINPATVEVAVRTVGAGRVSVDVLAGEKQAASAAADTTGEITLTLTVPNAKLWDVEHPNLYTCRVRFGSDEDLQTFGIRTLSWGKKGILLNGERVIVQGACIHHDQGILGARCYAQGEERRVRLLKENGYNAVRSAHNPCSKALLDACDRLGMLMMDEYIDHWYIHKTEYDYVPYFDKWWKQDIADMVDKDYNHPCVILYSTGNEVSETAQKKGIQLTRELTDYLHSLDNTRPVTCGINIFFNFLSSIGFGVHLHGAGAVVMAGVFPDKVNILVGEPHFNVIRFGIVLELKRRLFIAEFGVRARPDRSAVRFDMRVLCRNNNLVAFAMAKNSFIRNLEVRREAIVVRISIFRKCDVRYRNIGNLHAALADSRRFVRHHQEARVESKRRHHHVVRLRGISVHRRNHRKRRCRGRLVHRGSRFGGVFRRRRRYRRRKRRFFRRRWRCCGRFRGR